MLGIELKVFISDDEEAIEKAELLNQPIPSDAIKLIPITFYNIDSVEFSNDDVTTCIVNSGGIEYTVNESYKSVNEKILQRLAFKFN